MTKASYTIRIDPTIWEAFQEVFPGKASPMIEEYFRQVISTEKVDGASREDLLLHLKNIEDEKNKKLVEEKALISKLKLYDEQVVKKKELLESKEAEEKRETYSNLPSNIRSTVADITSIITELKIQRYLPAYAFRFYFEVLLDDEEQAELFKIADKNKYFELNGKLLYFNRLYKKHKEEMEE